MKIDIVISAEDIKKSKLEHKIVLVIDMFRATSVIVTALNNGCKKIIPLLTVEEAFKMAENIGREKCILGGERRATKIEGFDISNSPLEYSKEIVHDRTIIMTTTNGTKALTACENADKIFIGSMINGLAVAKKLISLNKDAVIVNAGTNGNFSMDDFICSGYIINEMMKRSDKLDLTDISKTANSVYESNPNIMSYIKDATHYSVMKSLNLEEDISYCMQKSIVEIVPQYINGVIIEKIG